jgi:hypothetical protein
MNPYQMVTKTMILTMWTDGHNDALFKKDDSIRV